MHRVAVPLLGLALLLVSSSTAPADEQADAKAIIEKAVAARGGLDKLGKVTAGVTKTKGKFHGMGQEIPFTGTNTVQLPDKQRNELTAEVMGVPFEIVVVFNGKEGWRSTPQGLQEFSPDQVAEQKAGQHASRVTNLVALLKEPGYTLKPLGESKVDGKTLVGVKVSKEGQREVTLFFDPSTGLLARSESRGKDPQQGTEFKTETTYADWKDFDGIKHATKTTTLRDGKVFLEGEVLEVKSLDKVDAKLFDKPAE